MLLLLEYCSVVYECYDKATCLNQILQNSEQPSILQNLGHEYRTSTYN